MKLFLLASLLYSVNIMDSKKLKGYNSESYQGSYTY